MIRKIIFFVVFVFMFHVANLGLAFNTPVQYESLSSLGMTN